MHLTLDMATVKSFALPDQKQEHSPGFEQPNIQWDQRDTDTPCPKQGSCFLNIETTLEAAWMEKSEGIPGKVGIELSSAKAPSWYSNSPSSELSGETALKSDGHNQKKPECPKSQPTANIASRNSEGDPPGQEPHPKARTQLEFNCSSNDGCACAGSENTLIEGITFDI